MRSQSLVGPKVALSFLVTCPLFAHAVKMNACGDRLEQAAAAAWNATHPFDPPPQFNLTYEQCLSECGRGLGDLGWGVFTQSVTTWFVPWIVLSFQFPYGAEHPRDDILAFFITIGSPALAAYSLQITQLNAHWLTQVFSDIDHPSSNAIPTAISALQHIPIQLSANPVLLPSLIVLPQNNAYWQLLLKSARKIRRWSLLLIVNFGWAVVAALLSIIDSFSRPIPGEIGYGTVTTLAYLLPLTIGWLHVGSEPEPNHLRDSLEEANEVALVATKEGDEPVFAESLPGQPQRAIEKKLHEGPARRDELKTNPLYNYSRVFVWSKIAEVIYTSARNATAKAQKGSPTIDGRETNMAAEGRNWTAYEVICRCKAEGSTFEKVFKTPHHIILPFFVPPVEIQDRSLWATGVWKRVALATALAIGLQWGTTGAGMFMYYKMHPVGLGCRTTALLIYGIFGTVSFLLLLGSSTLAHLHRPRSGSIYPYSRLRSLQGAGAILTRRLGKTMAVVSGVGILLVSIAQPLGVFDNCWCSTRTFDRPGGYAAFMDGDFVREWGILKVWISGLVTAFATSILFGFSLYLGTPRRR